MNFTLLILFIGLLGSGAVAAQAELIYQFAVDQDGIYRISHDDMEHLTPVLDSASLALFEQGQEIPILVEDHGDGLFNAGDYIIFSGRHLRGNSSWFNQFSRQNVYQLGVGQKAGMRMHKTDPAALNYVADSAVVQVGRHLERESIRVALPDAGNSANTEFWYWQRLSQLDQPFFIPLEARPSKVRVSLTGQSQDQNAIAAGQAEHTVAISLDGQPVASAEWHAQDSIVLEFTDLGAPLPTGDEHRLGIKVPRRESGQPPSSLIDVVLLNWVEVEFPFSGDLRDGRESVIATTHGRTLPIIESQSDKNGVLQLFSPSGQVYHFEDWPAENLLLNEIGTWQLVANQRYLAPSAVRRTGAITLQKTNQQADYLVITHPSLREAIQPLVKYHTSQGLRVSVVDTDTIYNEFNHGIQSPAAIRDFVHFARHEWQAPAPRFVLLVGDTVWDNHQLATAQKNLVPTLQVQAHDELAASDNGFVAVDGDSWRPQLAIGRLPARNAKELSHMVDKILHYHLLAKAQPWQSRIAWVTDRDAGFQSISNQLASQMEQLGYESTRIYPSPSAATAEHDQGALLQAFNQGSLIVHFVGHGGRYVWRTGPPDYSRSTDLFSVDDIQSLQVNHPLPLVLSMTCSSGPFDHPVADSIAEVFLRLPDRGAIAVLAASWRIPASLDFSAALMNELTAPDATIGEAIMRAKQVEKNRALVESYNLLGDPALRLKSSWLVNDT